MTVSRGRQWLERLVLGSLDHARGGYRDVRGSVALARLTDEIVSSRVSNG